MYFINCNTCDLIDNNTVVYNTVMCFMKYFSLKMSVCGSSMLQKKILQIIQLC